MASTERSLRFLRRIQLKEISHRQMLLGLLVAILLQWSILGLFYFDVIHDPNHQPGTFIFHQGGDQDGYFALAESIWHGKLIPSKFTLGYPLLLIPWIALFHPANSTSLIPPVALFNAGLLFPLGQALFLILAYRIMKQRTLALASVLLWTVFPLLLYVGLVVAKHTELGAIWAVHLIWPQMLSDPPTAFLTLVSFWLLFKIIDLPSRRGLAVILGIVCGLTLLIRINAILSVGVVILVLGLTRRWIPFVLATVGTTVCFLPQFVYNAVYFGNPFTMGYQVLDTQPPHGLISPFYLIQILTGKYAILMGVGTLPFSIVTIAAYRLWRVDRIGGAVILLWGIGYLLFFSFYYYSWTGSLPRFLLPAYPAYAVLLANVLFGFLPIRSSDPAIP